MKDVTYSFSFAYGGGGSASAMWQPPNEPPAPCPRCQQTHWIDALARVECGACGWHTEEPDLAAAFFDGTTEAWNTRACWTCGAIGPADQMSLVVTHEQIDVTTFADTEPKYIQGLADRRYYCHAHTPVEEPGVVSVGHPVFPSRPVLRTQPGPEPEPLPEPTVLGRRRITIPDGDD